MKRENDYQYEHLKGKSGIYKLVNKQNNKIYVGSAVNLYRRRQEHRSKLNNGSHFNDHLISAWNKYGIENFIFQIIELVEDNDKLIDREQYWIDALGAYEFGYNLSKTANSRLGSSVDEETRIKISEKLKEYFKSLSNQDKKELYDGRSEKISKAKLANRHRMSNESKLKISMAKKGIKLGKRPKEVKDKISNSKTGHKNTPEGVNHWNSVATNEQVVDIKIKLSKGLSVKEISEMTGFKPYFIYYIRSNKSKGYSKILPELNLYPNETKDGK
ncbi:GIY-YIG nuclease family protein [Bacillus sp. S13(2024)]|uniref:GIY-YIG nuclease family protein n=1 Tax=Bacillus sp. S13(2024) TaxID=3162885 RepID=UPI003D1BBACA